MLTRDENGTPVGAEKLSDLTDAFKEIEKKLNKGTKKHDTLSEDEKAELIKCASDIQPMINLVTPELQKTASPMELLSFLKQVAGLKKLGDTLKEMKND